jgi:DNA-binding Lrp family transcriptional regulator
MTALLNMRNPKKIFNALTTEPMTKVQLAKKTRLPLPRVHEAISRLEKEGLVSTYDTLLSARGREMKLHGVTPKGVIAYLASLQLEPPDKLIPLSAGETLEEYQAKREKEEEQYRKELEKLARFLETQGRLLDYPLFKETRWLAERYGDAFFDDVLDVARLIAALQPFLPGAMQLAKHYQKQVNKLKEEKLKLQTTQREIVTIVTEEGKSVETDLLEDIKEELREAEDFLKTLRDQENKWWSMSFAARFAERFQYHKGKGNMHNETLHAFFKQVADFFRRLEVESSENMAKIFEKPAA